MPITLVNNSASIGTTEYSLPSASTTRVAQTDSCVLQVLLDLNALTHGDEFRVRLYEATAPAGTQRVAEEWWLVGLQSTPIWIGPSIIVGAAWDITIQRTAGADRNILWSLRKVT
jgi:hypothetical protein